MAREAEELEIAAQPAAAEPLVARDHRPHLIEEHLAGDAAPHCEARLQAQHQGPQILSRIELDPEEARVPEHHQQGVAHAPRESTVREVDLGLLARWGLVPHHGLRQRPPGLHVRAEPGDPARIPRGPALAEQPDRAELGEVGEARLDQRLEGL